MCVWWCDTLGLELDNMNVFYSIKNFCNLLNDYYLEFSLTLCLDSNSGTREREGRRGEGKGDCCVFLANLSNVKKICFVKHMEFFLPFPTLPLLVSKWGKYQPSIFRPFLSSISFYSNIGASWETSSFVGCVGVVQTSNAIFWWRLVKEVSLVCKSV